MGRSRFISIIIEGNGWLLIIMRGFSLGELPGIFRYYLSVILRDEMDL